MDLDPTPPSRPSNSVVPVVVRAFNFWLSPPPSRRVQFEILGLLAVLAGYAVAVTIFMRLF